MRRFLIAATAVTLLLGLAVSVACGGGSAQPTPTAAPTEVVTPTTMPGKQGPVQDAPLPTPTKLAADAVAFSVVNGKTNLALKADEARALDKTTVTIDGKSYSGISITLLAQKVGAKPDSYFTAEGIRADGKRLGIVRGSLAEMGSNSVFVPLDDGHFNIVFSGLPADQWIQFVEYISFK